MSRPEAASLTRNESSSDGVSTADPLSPCLEKIFLLHTELSVNLSLCKCHYKHTRSHPGPQSSSQIAGVNLDSAKRT